MRSSTQSFPIVRVAFGDQTREQDIVVMEYPLTIYLEKQPIVTLFCTPKSLRQLVIGYLYSERYIHAMEDIAELTIDEGQGAAHVIRTAEAQEATRERKAHHFAASKGNVYQSLAEELRTLRITESVAIRPEQLMTFMEAFTQKSEIFSKTGGVHSCGLYTYEAGCLIFEDDIGRHNAYDKVFGHALERGICVTDKMILTSGRISAEMMLKAARRRVPMIVSKSAPMSLAIELAHEIHMTLIGFVRGERLNIYTDYSEEA